MTIWIFTGGRPSNSAKELAKQPGFKRVRTNKYLKAADLLINWGCSQVDYPNLHVLNRCFNVKVAANKLMAFDFMHKSEISVVPYTVDHAVVDAWAAEGATIIARQTLTGHSGQGIIVVEKGEPIPPALLYTKYVFKTKEWRVHVVGDEVVDTQRKIRDPDREPVSWKVRSHANGFIYTRNGIVPSNHRDELATAAVKSLGLHFGAVDIIEDKHGHLYVLEINTAPGLEGQTIKSYEEAFRKASNAAH